MISWIQRYAGMLSEFESNLKSYLVELGIRDRDENITFLNLVIWCQILISDYLLVCRFPDTPGINWQIKVFNGDIEPEPIFSVFHSSSIITIPARLLVWIE